MPVLSNKKHEKIAQELAFGGHHSKGAAYLAAGFGKTKEAAESHISRMMTKHKEIGERAAELTGLATERTVARIVERVAVTVESLVDELEQARALALAIDQPNAAVAASMGKARITGKIIDRKEVGEPGEFERLSDQDLLAEMRAAFEAVVSPEGGRRLN